MNRKLNLFLAAILMLTAVHVSGQTWVVPAEKSAVVNPSDYNLTNVKKGKDLYMLNCKSCHGDPGKNNPLPLVPLPPDVASEIMQANTEGDMFYKITHGKGSMPQFETTISEDNRWRIVNFIMNFSSKRKQLLVDTPPVKAKLTASINEDYTRIEIFAEYEAKNGEFKNLSDILVIISAKKTFGKLEIGQALTDKNGKAEFVVPETIVCNSEGMATLIISLNEDYIAEELSLENIKTGNQIITPKLIKRGVLWSTNDYVPFWLLLSYLGVVGGAWLAIGYVVFQIIKIRKYSKS